MPVPGFSLEFFPPKSLDGSFKLWNAVNTLTPLAPDFVSVTSGAGGTTRNITHQAVKTIQQNYRLNVAAHLTCVEASRAETLAIADSYAQIGVTDIVALRGDAPGGRSAFKATKNGFESACQLITALADTGNFTIRVAAYPDRHPEAASDTADVDWLKRKFDGGAASAITQFFFEADTFFRFRDACARGGITAPIIPGILPIENFHATKAFASRCGTAVPGWLCESFETAKRDHRHDLLAIAICCELCSDLIDGGVENLHYYTLNKPHLTHQVIHALGLAPDLPLEKVA